MCDLCLTRWGKSNCSWTAQGHSASPCASGEEGPGENSTGDQNQTHLVWKLRGHGVSFTGRKKGRRASKSKPVWVDGGGRIALTTAVHVLTENMLSSFQSDHKLFFLLGASPASARHRGNESSFPKCICPGSTLEAHLASSHLARKLVLSPHDDENNPKSKSIGNWPKVTHVSTAVLNQRQSGISLLGDI